MALSVRPPPPPAPPLCRRRRVTLTWQSVSSARSQCTQKLGGAGAMDAGAMGALPTRDELFAVLLKGKQLEQTMKDRQAGGG